MRFNDKIKVILSFLLAMTALVGLPGQFFLLHERLFAVSFSLNKLKGPLTMKNPPAVLETQNDAATLIHVTEGTLQLAIAEIPHEYNNLSEKALEGAITPTELDYLLRSSFSRELERVRVNGGVVKSVDVYGDFCSKSYWCDRYIKSKKRMAWIIRPMPRYEKAMEAMLYVTNRRLWEIIQLPLRVNGKVSPSLLTVMLSAIRMVKENVKGMPVQRSESKILSVNVDTQATAKIQDMSMDQINKEIKKLENKLEAMSEEHRGEPEPIVEKDDDFTY